MFGIFGLTLQKSLACGKLSLGAAYRTNTLTDLQPEMGSGRTKVRPLQKIHA